MISGRSSGEIHHERNSGLLGAQRHDGAGFANQPRHGDGLERQTVMPGLDGGQIEKRVHHAEHVFAGLMNDLRIALASFEQHEVAATHQDFRVADDGIERRPQLVADGCEQFGPRIVGADGLATKRVAFFRIATMGRDVARDGDGRAGEIVAEPHAMDPHLDPDETAAVGSPDRP